MGTIPSQTDRSVVDGTEYVAGAVGGFDRKILISKIRAYVVTAFSNKTQLDKISESGGVPLYDGNPFVSPAGNDTEVQFNDGGIKGSSNLFTFLKTTSVLSLLGANYPQFILKSTATFPVITLDKTGGSSWNIENGRTSTELGLRVSGATRFTFSAAGDLSILGDMNVPTGKTYKRNGVDIIGIKTPQALTQSTGTLTWNVANGYNARVTLSANITTFTFSGAITGDSGVLTVIQDATGSRTMVLPSGHLKEGGSLTLSTAANAKDVLGWYFDGTNYFWNIGKAFA